ncbi:hypothetical protein Tco_1269212 [Tanacetum coccineum]
MLTILNCKAPVRKRSSKKARLVAVMVAHLGSTWRKYMHFRLNLGRNGTRLKLYSKLLKVLVPDREDSVNIPCDAIRALKG